MGNSIRYAQAGESGQQSSNHHVDTTDQGHLGLCNGAANFREPLAAKSKPRREIVWQALLFDQSVSPKDLVMSHMPFRRP